MAGTRAIEGFTERRFDTVREIFAANFSERGELGAAFCVYQNGRPVIDLWGGVADPETSRPWAEDTTCVVDSATKAVTAVCALMLVDSGDLKLDAPVAEYWPEFAAEGKETLPVRYLLTHQAGLPAVDHWITMEDCEAWDPITEALAAQRPYWEPGAAHGYHGLTMGWLVGEVVRRISGLTPGQYVEKNIAPALGLDLWIGLPESEESRVAMVTRPSFESFEASGDDQYDMFSRKMMELYTNPRYLEAYMDPSKRDAAIFAEFHTLGEKAFGPVELGLDMNAPRYLALEVPAATGIATARSLAKFYSALVSEVEHERLLTPELVGEAARPHAVGPDQVLLLRTAWGLGFSVPGGPLFPTYGQRVFGHPGANGTLGFADLDRGLAFGYLRNHMLRSLPDPRSEPLVRSVYACLDNKRGGA